jgi:hypothetical protein
LPDFTETIWLENDDIFKFAFETWNSNYKLKHFLLTLFIIDASMIIQL